MASGVSGYVDFTGTWGITLRVHYSETYDIATNTSDVTITNVQVASSSYFITYYLNGTISIGGSVAITMDSRKSTHRVKLTGLNTFCDIEGALGAVKGIAHSEDGARTVAISVSVTGYTTSGQYGNGWVASGASNVALTTIPRKSSLTVSNGTLGEKLTLTVNRQISSYTHTIAYACGSESGTICTKSSSTSLEWTPPVSLASQNTKGTAVSIVFTITTFNGDASLGSNSETISCAIPESIRPGCTIEVSDASGNYEAFGAYLQGCSYLKVVVAPTTSYGSEIATTAVTADGTTYYGSTVFTNAIKGSGKLTITATVTDERGRAGSASATIDVLAYTAPAITLLSAKRCNSDGTLNESGDHILVTMSAKVTALDNKNTAAYKLEYKQSSLSTYTAVWLTDYNNNYSVSDITYIIADNSGLAYDIRFTVMDNLNYTVKTTSAPIGFVLMKPRANGKGIGFGKAPEHDGMDLGFPIWLNGHQIYDAAGNIMFAPAGYGMEATAIPPNTSLDELHTNGWYQCGASTVGAPTGHRYVEYGTVFVINRWGNHTTQFYVTQPDTVAGSPLMLVRGYNVASSAWTPWEWINPPMDLNVEYRTTERHLGSAVYTKLIDCGTLTNGATVPIDTSITVIRFSAHSTNKVAYPYHYPTSDYHRSVAISSGSITLLCGAKASGADTVHCQIWYIK